MSLAQLRDSEKTPVLIVTAGSQAFAIPLQHVAELMRPLPIEPIAGAPRFVRGVSVIRGSPTPVVDLRALLRSEDDDTGFGRIVSLKVGQRRVALGVESVLGVRSLELARLGELPPLLREGASEIIEGLMTSDAKLLYVLRAARIVPDEVWAQLAKGSREP